MTIVKVGTLNDLHVGGWDYSLLAYFNAALLECDDGQIGCDLVWVLGDIAHNLVTWSPLPGTNTDDIENEYIAAENAEKNRGFDIQNTPGNHDIYKEIFENHLGACCSVRIISGLRFIVIDSAPKVNSTKQTTMTRCMREEIYGRCDEKVLNWLKNELDRDVAIPTFIGMHHLLHPFNDGTYDYRPDTTSWGQALGYCDQDETRMKYWLVENRHEVKSILEDAKYTVVAVFSGHAFHANLTTDGNIWHTTANGVDYFHLKHTVWDSMKRFGWLYLDTATPSNSKVYERNRLTHVDTLVKSLSWS